MWVLTPFGFFSIVAHWDAPEVLVVRSRVRSDLVAFAKRAGKPRPKVRTTPANDYPFRLELERGRFAELLRTFVLDDLTYPNFKSEVGKRQGFARAHAYHEVWETLRGIEEPGARSCTPSPAGLGVSSQ
jgi:hypothetical protein